MDALTSFLSPIYRVLPIRLPMLWLSMRLEGWAMLCLLCFPQGLTRFRLWGEMAYCAYISGVIMGSAGLGYVHSIAGSMGALHPVPAWSRLRPFACTHHKCDCTRDERGNPQNHVVRFEKLNRLSQLWKVEGPRGGAGVFRGSRIARAAPS